MVINDLKDQIPLREISRISGISLSGYYYKPVKRHIQRLDPSIKERIRDEALRQGFLTHCRIYLYITHRH